MNTSDLLIFIAYRSFYRYMYLPGICLCQTPTHYGFFPILTLILLYQKTSGDLLVPQNCGASLISRVRA